MNEQILRLPAVIQMTGKSRSGIYSDMKADKFPRQVKIGVRAVGWTLSSIQDYIRSKVDAGR